MSLMVHWDGMTVRKSAEWMAHADERILELLDQTEPRSPTEIVDDGRVHFSRQHVNNRCLILAERGLLQKLGNGVYRITDDGRAYLAGDLDASQLEPRQ